MMTDFQFLYPLWLLTIPVLLLVLVWIYRYRDNSALWNSFIDPALQRHVISGQHAAVRKRTLAMLGLGGLLAILALAGPSLHKQTVPAYRINQGLVVGLDLSSSMLATDIQPDRLERAKFELVDLMKARHEGQTGLVVFAGDAFAVSPLTNDVDTIIAQVEHLDPYTMPTQGSRMDRAIGEAVLLLQQSGYQKGHILLITDGATNREHAVEEARLATEQNFDVSILAMGTPQGAQIPIRGGGMMTDRQGNVVTARLDEDALRSVADAGNGLYLRSSVDDSDLTRLLESYEIDTGADVAENKNQSLEHRVNDGIWLLLPLIPLVMLMFRKGVLWIFLIALLLPMPEPANAFDWSSLWYNDDQLGQQAFDKGETDEAESLFENPQWMASAAYRNGKYAKALELFSGADTADSLYNQGNTLAFMGKIPEAISAYEAALEKDPHNGDAKHNLELLKKFMKNRQQNSQSQQQQKSREKQEKENQQQQGNQQAENGQQRQQNNETQPSAGEEKKNQEQSSQQQKEQESGEQTADAQPEEQKNPQKEQQNDNKKSEAALKRIQERNAYNKQWLRKIPDDPSGLWRRKFEYQYQQRGQRYEEQPW